MKILQTNIINKFIKGNYFNTFKTKPYPNDMVCLSRMHNNKLSFKDKMRMFFGLHPKLNAKSFASGKETYTQNHKIIDITKPNPKAATYFNVENIALYYH